MFDNPVIAYQVSIITTVFSGVFHEEKLKCELNACITYRVLLSTSQTKRGCD